MDNSLLQPNQSSSPDFFDYEEHARTHPHDYYNVMGWIGAFLVIAMIIVGTVGNIMVLVGVLMFERLRKSYNVFIASLSATDLLFNVLIMPFFADSFYYRRWRFNIYFCKFHVFFGTVLIMCSSLHISLIAINRYILVVHLPLYPTFSKPPVLAIQIAIIWLVSMASVFPGALGWHAKVDYTDQISRCTYVRSQSRESLDIVFCMGFVLPCLVVMVCYGLIIYKSKQSQNKVNSYKANTPHEQISFYERFCIKSDAYFHFIHKNHLTHRSRSYEYISSTQAPQHIPSIQIDHDVHELINPQQQPQQQRQFPSIEHQIQPATNVVENGDPPQQPCTESTSHLQPPLFNILMLMNKTQSKSTLSECVFSKGKNKCIDCGHEKEVKDSNSKLPMFYFRGDNKYNRESINKINKIDYLPNEYKNEKNGFQESTKLMHLYNNKCGETSIMRVAKSFIRRKARTTVPKNTSISSSCPQLGTSQSNIGIKYDFLCFLNNTCRGNFNKEGLNNMNKCAKIAICPNCRKRKFILKAKIKEKRHMKRISNKIKKNTNPLIRNDKYFKRISPKDMKGRLNNKRFRTTCWVSSLARAPSLARANFELKTIKNKENLIFKNNTSTNSKDASIEKIELQRLEKPNIIRKTSSKKCKNSEDSGKITNHADETNKLLSLKDSHQKTFLKVPLSHPKSESLMPHVQETPFKKVQKVKRRNSMKMIFVIFTAFALTYLPFTVLNLADDGARLSRDWYMITSLFFWAGSCTNPIIYGVLNHHFRKSYFDMLSLLVSLFRRRKFNKSSL